jgi:translation initiation factor IF-2
VITNSQPTHDVVEANQATDKAAPDASGDKSTSVSNEVDTASTQEATPAKALPEPELGQDPATRPPSTYSSAPPPLPEKDTAVTNKPTLTSEETSASPSQATEPAPTKVEDKAEEPSAQPTESEAPATENADSSKLDTAEEEGPNPQSGVDGDNRAVDEGSATQDGDGKADGATKLTLLTDRVRELSTASIMSASSSTPGTPAEEVASSAVDEEESGAPEQGGTLSKKKTKKEKEKEKKEKEREKKKNKKKNKGEKNSPHPPSGETVHNADNSSIQDRNPPVVANPPSVDIPSGEGEGELVEKVASSEEDAPVMVDKVDSSGEDSAVKVERPQGEAGKTADGDSGTDEWMDW